MPTPTRIESNFGLPNEDRILITDASVKTSYGKVNIKEIANAFSRHPIILNDTNYLDTHFVLLPIYRFLINGTLEPLRLAYEFFDSLKEIKDRDAKENTSISYKINTLAERLKMKADENF